MGDFERPRIVRPEEGLHYLFRLIAARIVRIGENRYLQIVGKPGGKLVGVSESHVLGYRVEDVIAVILRGSNRTSKDSYR